MAQNVTTRGEVDAAFYAAHAAGAVPRKPPEEAFRGGCSGYFADAEGHVREVAFSPFWPLGADGGLALAEAR